MRLGIFVGLSAVVGCGAMIAGEFGWSEDRDLLILAGCALVAAAIVGCAALLAASFPRLLLGFCAATTAVLLAGAIALFLAGHARYAVVFGFWTKTACWPMRGKWKP